MTEDLDRGGHVHTNRDPGAMGAGSLFIRCCGGAENTENSFRHTYTHLSVFASGLIQSSLATEGVKEQTAVDHTHTTEKHCSMVIMITCITWLVHTQGIEAHTQDHFPPTVSSGLERLMLISAAAHCCKEELIMKKDRIEEREHCISHQTLLTLGWCYCSLWKVSCLHYPRPSHVSMTIGSQGQSHGKGEKGVSGPNSITTS